MYSDHDTLAGGLPHSDIHGSKPARGSPWLFAACYVLHRLLVPRHPPNALIALTRTMHRNHPCHAASTHSILLTRLNAQRCFLLHPAQINQTRWVRPTHRKTARPDTHQPIHTDKDQPSNISTARRKALRLQKVQYKLPNNGSITKTGHLIR